MSEAYRDYFCNQAQQPVLDNILNVLNPTSITLISQSTLGLVFNTTELCVNAAANVFFIHISSIFHNVEGVARLICFQTIAGNTIYYPFTIASGTSQAFNSIVFLFGRIRITTAGGLVTNAATYITINCWRIVI